MKLTSLIYKLSRLQSTAKRVFQIPQQIRYSPFQQYTLVETTSFNFLMKQKCNKKQLLVHLSNTPASVLQQDYLHLLHPQISKKNLDQKYNSYKRLLKQKYNNSFKTCKTGVDIFHMTRRINIQIRNKQNMIGVIQDRYKHFQLWCSYRQSLGRKTLEQYGKNGVKIDLLNQNIIPVKQVWMPTRQNYLELFEKYLLNTSFLNKIQNVIDLGCGCGVLSFLLSRKLKKNAKIIGLDINQNAVQTANINAAKLNIQNFTSFQCDISKSQNYLNLKNINKLPQQYDLIISNPPWLISKKLSDKIGLQDGVYDQKELFLKSVFGFTKKYLKKNGRLVLIYSSLSKEIGLTKNSIEDICKIYNMSIKQNLQIPYTQKLQSQDWLNMFKQKSKINVYSISGN